MNVNSTTTTTKEYYYKWIEIFNRDSYKYYKKIPNNFEIKFGIFIHISVVKKFYFVYQLKLSMINYQCLWKSVY